MHQDSPKSAVEATVNAAACCLNFEFIEIQNMFVATLEKTEHFLENRRHPKLYLSVTVSLVFAKFQ
jgi:hypothetical protein